MFLCAEKDSEILPVTCPSDSDQCLAVESLSTVNDVPAVTQSIVVSGSGDVNNDIAVLMTVQDSDEVKATDNVITEVEVRVNEIETGDSVQCDARDELPVEKSPSTNKSSELTCDICKRVFTSLKYYGKHISKCEIDLSCAKCKKSFKNMKTLRQHLLNLHLDNKKCDSCGERFSTEKKLEKHKNRFHDSAEVKCENCNAVFKNRKSLSVHKAKKVCPALVEAGKKASNDKENKKTSQTQTYQCDQCRKTYGSKRGLRYHKQCHRMVHVQTEKDEDQNSEKQYDFTVDTSNIIPEGVEGVDYFVIDICDSN